MKILPSPPQDPKIKVNRSESVLDRYRYVWNDVPIPKVKLVKPKDPLEGWDYNRVSTR